MKSRSDGSSVTVLEASLGAPYEPNTPPHLAAMTWVVFERDTAFTVWESLERELFKLSQKFSPKRVHDARIALRRWNSVWGILKRDGFESKKCAKKVDKKLQKLLKVLGAVRDVDVNLELGAKVGVSQKVLDKWVIEQNSLSKAAKKYVQALDVDQLVKEFDKCLNRRARKLSRQLFESSYGQETAYQHLERYLVEQEKAVLDMERSAKTPPELHQLRLGIKAWRFFLAEFFGLTSIGLYKTQQDLGRFNDLTRIGELIGDLPDEETARQAIKKHNEANMKLFAKSRKQLPYGLRPAVLSPLI